MREAPPPTTEDLRARYRLREAALLALYRKTPLEGPYLRVFLQIFHGITPLSSASLHPSPKFAPMTPIWEWTVVFRWNKKFRVFFLCFIFFFLFLYFFPPFPTTERKSSSPRTKRKIREREKVQWVFGKFSRRISYPILLV